MPDALGRTPEAPSVNGTKYTWDTLAKDPKRISRVIAPGPQVFPSDYLFRRDTTSSGAVVFNQARSNGAYPEKGGVQEIAPGAEYPLIDLGEETVDTAVVTKHGVGFRVLDESTRRKSYDETTRALMLARNALQRQNAHRLWQAFLDAGVPTRAAVAGWNTSSANPRRDLRGAQKQVKDAGFGYQARTVMAHSSTLFELEMNPLFEKWMPRETANLNPFLNAGLNGFLNVEYLENDEMTEDEILVITRKITGVDVIERDVFTEPIRETGGKTLYQVDRNSVPIITDPLSAVRLQGVLV